MASGTGYGQFIFEVCVDNLKSAIAAEEGGALRIELCSSLSEGGLTPSYGFFKMVKQVVHIPIFVMIRPRGGDFLYDSGEVDIMKEDIKIFRSLGADGFVFGCLDKNGKINQQTCIELANICNGKPMTFHRAFDLTTDNPFETLEILIKLGFNRILTSGQKSTALQGKELIRQLVQVANNRIIIMPGSGINDENVQEIVYETGVKEFHASARKKIVSLMMTSNNTNSKDVVTMGNTDNTNILQVTDSQLVRRMLNNVQQKYK